MYFGSILLFTISKYKLFFSPYLDLYGLINEVNVECNSNDIRITLNAPHPFNGMIYPKGLSKNSSCMAEYTSATNFTYQLPLRACNTMSSEVVSINNVHSHLNRL